MINKIQIWKNWNHLVNVEVQDIESTLDSDIGKEIINQARSVEEQGLYSVRQSANALLRMLPSGHNSFGNALVRWKNEQYKGLSFWDWAIRQILFINKEKEKLALAKDRGFYIRLLSLKLWGHDLYHFKNRETPKTEHKTLSIVSGKTY